MAKIYLPRLQTFLQDKTNKMAFGWVVLNIDHLTSDPSPVTGIDKHFTFGNEAISEKDNCLILLNNLHIQNNFAKQAIYNSTNPQILTEILIIASIVGRYHYKAIPLETIQEAVTHLYDNHLLSDCSVQYEIQKLFSLNYGSHNVLSDDDFETFLKAINIFGNRQILTSTILTTLKNEHSKLDQLIIDEHNLYVIQNSADPYAGLLEVLKTIGIQASVNTTNNPTTSDVDPKLPYNLLMEHNGNKISHMMQHFSMAARLFDDFQNASQAYASQAFSDDGSDNDPERASSSQHKEQNTTHATDDEYIDKFYNSEQDDNKDKNIDNDGCDNQLTTTPPILKENDTRDYAFPRSFSDLIHDTNSETSDNQSEKDNTHLNADDYIDKSCNTEQNDKEGQNSDNNWYEYQLTSKSPILDDTPFPCLSRSFSELFSDTNSETSDNLYDSKLKKESYEMK